MVGEAPYIISEHALLWNVRVTSAADHSCHALLLYESEAFLLTLDYEETISNWEILSNYGYSNVGVKEISVDNVVVDDIATLPTIDLCGHRIIGYKEENDLAIGVLNVVVKSCLGSNMLV